MKPLVSVIVPVYKVEKYLPKCLDSLCRQNLSPVEFLLIDDASPDNCGAICDAYEAEDSRFKVFHNIENKGLAAVRNIGVQLADSDFIMFVDSDDWVTEDYCQVAYKCAMQQHADLVMFAYWNVKANEYHKLENGSVSKVESGFKTREEAIEFTFDSFGMVAWNKLYHKRLFQGIKYPEGDLFEDTATTYKLIWNASRIYCIDNVLYFHLRARPGSIMSNRNIPEAIQDSTKVMLQHSYDLYSWGYRSERLETALVSAALHYCVVNTKDVSDENYLVAEKILNGVCNIPERNSWKAKIMIKLFQVNQRLFNFVCSLFGKRV